VTGYVLDHWALTAGLAGAGSEHHRRELSRLLRGAIDGGPILAVPALCLTAATALRPTIADHLAEIIVAAPPGAIDVCGLTRSAPLETLRASYPGLGWPATHAAAHAVATGLPVLTLEPTRYHGVAIDLLSL